jgi:low temperature requirement protein LtrA
METVLVSDLGVGEEKRVSWAELFFDLVSCLSA